MRHSTHIALLATLALLNALLAPAAKGNQFVLWEIPHFDNAMLSVVEKGQYSLSAVGAVMKINPTLSIPFNGNRAIVPKNQFASDKIFYLFVHSRSELSFYIGDSIGSRVSYSSDELNNGIIVFFAQNESNNPHVQYSNDSQHTPLVRVRTLADFKLLADGKPIRVVSSQKSHTIHMPFDVDKAVTLRPDREGVVTWFGCDGIAEAVEKNECIVLPNEEYSISAISVK